MPKLIATPSQIPVPGNKIIDEYAAYVNGSPMIADIDNNGIVGVKVRATLVQALTMLSDKLT